MGPHRPTRCCIRLEGALSTGWLALTEEEQPVAPAAARLPQWLGNRRREMRAALRELCRCFELPLGRPRRDPGVSRHNAGLGISRRDPDLRRRPNRQNPPTASRRALPQRPRLAPVLGPHGASSRTCKAGRQARSVTEAGRASTPRRCTRLPIVRTGRLAGNGHGRPHPDGSSNALGLVRVHAAARSRVRSRSARGRGEEQRHVPWLFAGFSRWSPGPAAFARTGSRSTRHV